MGMGKRGRGGGVRRKRGRDGETEGGRLRVVFAAMKTPLHAREVEMLRGMRPSTSSTASHLFPPTLFFLYLLAFLFFSSLFVSSSSSTSTTFQVERGHPSTSCCPSSSIPATPHKWM